MALGSSERQSFSSQRFLIILRFRALALRFEKMLTSCSFGNTQPTGTSRSLLYSELLEFYYAFLSVPLYLMQLRAPIAFDGSCQFTSDLSLVYFGNRVKLVAGDNRRETSDNESSRSKSLCFAEMQIPIPSFGLERLRP